MLALPRVLLALLRPHKCIDQAKEVSKRKQDRGQDKDEIIRPGKMVMDKAPRELDPGNASLAAEFASIPRCVVEQPEKQLGSPQGAGQRQMTLGCLLKVIVELVALVRQPSQ